MQVTLNPYISTNRQIKQNQPQNVSFQSVYAPMAKKAMNPIHQKKGLVACGAGAAATAAGADATILTSGKSFLMVIACSPSSREISVKPLSEIILANFSI